MTALRVEGFGGQIDFDGTTVKISRDGWRATGPDREIALADIERLEHKAASALVNGHLRFVVPGLNAKRATADLNSVVFAKKHNADFEEMKNLISEAITLRGPLTATEIEEIAARNAKEIELAVAASLETLRKLDFVEYNGHTASYKGYRYLLGARRPIAGANAEFESGADRSRPTLTRIGAGALLAGPVGAIAGGMFKKDKTRVYVTIIFPDDATVIIDGPAKDEKKLRNFAEAVNRISRSEAKFVEQEAEDSNPVQAEGSPADQLLQLKGLLDAGVLTDEQYQQKAAPLIDQL
ncbi:hypothetical protein ICM05_09895 [Leucobacter sp. cx-42]|uniref:DUF4429 domain-containing protein n=1 Tax=unclassified Leucobacter TaxID=2621730 RepID=UPI00165D57D6|nr:MULTISPECIES: DUF4429 domain-containing protein [unclassified Leucobacter]MBC9954949.1 hypothetical protein [Leucobacter sp. cx-42]